MTFADEIHDRIETLRDKLKAVHGVGGRDLAEALRMARRDLPRDVRRAGQRIVAGQKLIGHPKLEQMLDPGALERDLERVVTHLDGVDVADLRRGRRLALLGRIVFNLMLVVGLFIAWMVWSGQF